MLLVFFLQFFNVESSASDKPAAEDEQAGEGSYATIVNQLPEDWAKILSPEFKLVRLAAILARAPLSFVHVCHRSNSRSTRLG